MARGLPKKYAKMGFKAGWKAYKATQKGGKKTRAKTRTRKRNVRKTAKRRNGISFTSGLKAQGLLLDAGWGLVGLTLLGKNNPSALPVTRVVQGLTAHTLFPGMGGKRRLVYGLLDMIDLWLASLTGPSDNGSVAHWSGMPLQGWSAIRNLGKVSPLD